MASAAETSALRPPRAADWPMPAAGSAPAAPETTAATA